MHILSLYKESIHEVVGLFLVNVHMNPPPDEKLDSDELVKTCSLEIPHETRQNRMSVRVRQKTIK